jgi:predicted TIM-barrel fold metal-dependent hydrolase
MNRRRFLQGTVTAAGAASVALLAAATPQAAQDKDKKEPAAEAPRIIDTHVHLWDLDRLRLPWLERGSPLNRSFVIRDYQRAIEGLNVVKGVYMEVDVDPTQLVAEAEFVLELCRQGGTPLVAAVIGGRPAADDFPQYLRRFRGNRFLKGVRQVLHTPATRAGFSTQENFIRGVRQLGEANLSFDMCMRPADLGDCVRLVEACPETRFILDHCGNGPVYAEDRTQWRRDMERLGRDRRVMCKISGIVVQARERWSADDLAPVINQSLDAFGPDRVMFAGDWPVCTNRATFRQWVEALRSIVRNRSAEDQRKLFHDNAARFYGLNA